MHCVLNHVFSHKNKWATLGAFLKRYLVHKMHDLCIKIRVKTLNVNAAKIRQQHYVQCSFKTSFVV